MVDSPLVRCILSRSPGKGGGARTDTCMLSRCIPSILRYLDSLKFLLPKPDLASINDANESTSDIVPRQSRPAVAVVQILC